MKKKNIIYIIVAALILLIAVLPYMGVLFHSLPRNDEFSCLIHTSYGKDYSMKKIFQIVVEQYFQWEGNYSGVFLYIFFNPMLTGNAELSMYIYNILSFSLFAFTFWYLAYRLIRLADVCKKDSAIISLIIFAAAINCRYLNESIGWFTGYMYYTIQLILGAIAMLMVAIVSSNKGFSRKKDILVVILAAFMTFMGCGGTLMVSSILCWLTLLLLAYNIWTKRDWIKAAILFVMTLGSTVFNLAAPGHYVRKDNYEKISIFKAAAYSLVCIAKECYRLCRETYLLQVLLIILIIAFVVIKTPKKNIEFHPVVVFLAGFLCWYAGVLPVCYGYGGYELESRGYEMLDILIAFWGGIISVSLANKLRLMGLRPERKNVAVASVVVALLIVVASLASVHIGSVPSIRCIRGLADGSVKEYSDYWRNVWREVVTSTEADVVIPVESKYLEDNQLVCRPLISEDPNNWVNLSMTYFYGHNSVRIEHAD